jgi:hypothetical protein
MSTKGIEIWGLVLENWYNKETKKDKELQQEPKYTST